MYTQIDGYNIHYEEIGGGDEVFVVLQGWGTGLEVYNSVAAILKEKYRVILFDLPGFGKSDVPRQPWNVDAYTDFFISFMKSFDIKSATLMGHSYGGRIILKLFGREDIGFKIKRILMVDAAGIMPKKSFRQRFRIKKYKILKKIFNLTPIYKLFPDLIDYWKSKQGSADYKNASPIMRQCLVMAVNEDLRDLLPKVCCETLLIWGEDDTATPISDARLMDEKIPDSGLAVIKNAGHYSFLDQPAVFRSIISSYLLND